MRASDGVADNYFGWSVGISGDTVVVGGSHAGEIPYDPGLAYIFGLRMNPGNIDLDGDVDFEDYCFFAQFWQETDCGRCDCNRADFTGDGKVDANDLREFVENWLEGK